MRVPGHTQHARNKSQVKSSQVISVPVQFISEQFSSVDVLTHSLPPLLAAGAHSLGIRSVVCVVYV